MSQFGEKFELEMLKFLETLGFKDINGGRNFKINNVQIDVIGGFENNLFIIECFSSYRKKRGGLRKKLREFKGVIPSIKRGLKKSKVYKKYENLIFVLALKNITPTSNDYKFSQTKPTVIIWDYDFILYYLKLFKAIGKYAVYNLLGELGIGPKVESKIILPALKIKLSNFNVYSFWVDPKKLLKYVYVARRERKEEHYYQRFVDKNRIKRMAKNYIDKNKFYPNSVIISIDDRVKFTPFPEWKNEIDEEFPSEFGLLEFPKKYRSCWIIDGQHRIYSFAHSKKTQYISVVAFERIKKEKQAEIFVDVNLNQKTVPPDLLWDLIGDLDPRSEMGIISNVVKTLNKKFLKNMFYIPSFGMKRKHQLKFSGICLAISKAGLASNTLYGNRRNPLYAKDPNKLKERLIRLLQNYFMVIEKVFDDNYKEKFVFTNGGLAVMIYYLSRILRRLNRIPNKKQLEKYLNPLKDYLTEAYPDDESIKNLRLSCNSEGGRSNKVNEFIMYVAEKINDKKFAEDIPTPLMELEEKIKKLENLLRIFIKNVLEKEDRDWLKKYLPPDIYSQILKNFKNKSKSDKRAHPWQFLTLGQCRNIIEKNWEIFEPFFLKEFESKDEVLFILQKLNRIRSPIFHGEGSYLKLKKKDYDLIEIYIDKILECIKI